MGISGTDASGGLAAFLPQIIDKLTLTENCLKGVSSTRALIF